MKPSPFRHPLAILRTVAGLSQQELADMVGVSRRTIQSVELRTLTLSEGLALKLAAATRVSVPWLLAGDVAAPILDYRGEPYTKSTFDHARASATSGLTAASDNGISNEERKDHILFGQARTIHYLIAAVSTREQLDLLNWKLDNAIEDIGDELGLFDAASALDEAPDEETTLAALARGMRSTMEVNAKADELVETPAGAEIVLNWALHSSPLRKQGAIKKQMAEHRREALAKAKTKDGKVARRARK